MNKKQYCIAKSVKGWYITIKNDGLGREKMDILWWLVGVLAAVLVLIVLIAYLCFRMAFYISNKEKKENALRVVPPGEEYLPYQDRMTAWNREVKALPCETFTIESFDGLRLQGKYYEKFPGAPIELMFHGYRGNARRDLCGGVQRCFACGRNALIVDQRASGDSDGNVISFGINERRDCHYWVSFMVEHFGPEAKILLTGISMGASTVLMAAGEELPTNVIGVLSDCGYTSAKEIICKVIRQMKLPAKVCYPFVRLGARLFGHFDLEETSPVEALKKCKLPVFFTHGDADTFVPCRMSQEMYEGYTGEKYLYLAPGAAHGLAFPVDEERYIKALGEFFIK